MTLPETVVPDVALTDSTTLRAWLEPARVAQQLSYADIHIALTVARRAAEMPQDPALTAVVALSTALTNRAVREGHSAIRVDHLVQHAAALTPYLAESPLNALVPTNSAEYIDLLKRSPATGEASANTPLVLHHQLVQFKRYHDAEQRIAGEIRRRLTETTPAGLPAFAIVTGGPGTGKTTHIARTIVQLHATQATVHVALAAPTGKAAARLTESVRERVAEVTQQRGGDVPSSVAEAQTLHRLLRYNAHTNTFRSTAVSPLGADLVVVDEASMVDILLLDALLQAVRADAALLLVGDHQQLASVESGDALGALWRAATSSSPESAWQGRVTVLNRSFRFGNDSAIGVFARAVMHGDTKVIAASAQPAFAEGRDEVHDVRVVPFAADHDTLLAPVIAGLTQCVQAQTPQEFLDAFDTFRVLAPEREGATGVEGMNQTIEQWLATQGCSTRGAWYHRRPVLVTANEYGANVFNGDIGVVWRDGDHTGVYFRTAGGGVRMLAPTRLPMVETAWAITVHKAQGSEFDSVLLVLPERESRVVNRQLLYTAVTRAKRAITIVGTLSVVYAAMAKESGRTSGLERAVLG